VIWLDDATAQAALAGRDPCAVHVGHPTDPDASIRKSCWTPIWTGRI
jgi:hypothetical protein